MDTEPYVCPPLYKNLKENGSLSRTEAPPPVSLGFTQVPQPRRVSGWTTTVRGGDRSSVWENRNSLPGTDVFLRRGRKRRAPAAAGGDQRGPALGGWAAGGVWPQARKRGASTACPWTPEAVFWGGHKHPDFTDKNGEQARDNLPHLSTSRGPDLVLLHSQPRSKALLQRYGKLPQSDSLT